MTQWTFEYHNSRLEWDKHNEMIKSHIFRQMAGSLASHIQQHELKQEKTPNMVRHYTSLIIATPEDYWADVRYEAERIAAQFGRIIQ